MRLKRTLADDRPMPILHGLPRLGKLVKGDKATRNADGRIVKPGKDLDYLRFKPAPGYEHLARLFTELYGEKPMTFESVLLLGNSADDVFSSCMEEWGAGSIKRRCDQEVQLIRYDADTAAINSFSPSDPAAPACELLCGRRCECKMIGRFSIFLPLLAQESNIFGYVTVETHSKHDILEIDAALHSAERIMGGLFGIEFSIARVEREISVPM